ncbi:probable transcription factor At5g61620 isoform X1 [Malania oleifera]|uniref:probable transcription factor At5g61620 isoform X1 n=1 Tax=Malania oleifera TaxID=397392 RepID=UPI0025AE4351|nr:probable transcription factor At5g61620 isoform X1 [Malania oleifera]
MVKESSRKCSHCGANGHNSRTCTSMNHHNHNNSVNEISGSNNNNNNKGCLKLFGVRIVADHGGRNSNCAADGKVISGETMRKSFSMSNLSESCPAADGAGAGTGSGAEHLSGSDAGYLSDGLIQSRKRKTAHERKRGIPWSEEEHRTFLFGLEKLGKGDWRGISKNFVISRTPTQVASHAQKYFNRLALSEQKKKRSSLFDMPFNEHVPSTRDSSVPPNIIETLSQANTKNVVEAQMGQTQANVSAKGTDVVPSPHLEVPLYLPVEASGVSNFSKVPYMQLAIPGSGQSHPNSNPKMIPTFPLVPRSKFKQGYVYVPKPPRNFAACAPIASRSEANMLPQPFPRGSSQTGPGSSSIEKVSLELGIAPPENRKGSNLSSQTSGPIRVT